LLNGVNELQDRSAKEKERRTQANLALIELTDSIFTGKKYLEVNSSVDQEFLSNFHGPRLEFNSLEFDNWSGKIIIEEQEELSENYINNFITDVGGTYALISIPSGPYSGDYLMFVI
jgi:hypothetical protein